MFFFPAIPTPCIESISVRNLHVVAGLSFACVFCLPLTAAAEPAVINPETTTYDSHMSCAKTESGATWFAWHACADGKDQVLARRVSADGRLEPLWCVSQAGSVHGPPCIIAESDEAVSVIWTAKTDDRWQVMLRILRGGRWRDAISLSDPMRAAIDPALIPVDDVTMIAAWSSHHDDRWNIRGCRIVEEQPSTPFDISTGNADACRPALVNHQDQTWAFWDQYDKRTYSVHGRVVFPVMTPSEQVSPADEYCLTPAALSHSSGLHVAWLRKFDVMGGPRVVSQWHTLHAAVRQDDKWDLIAAQDGDTAAAELTQGLVAKIDPEPMATGGYFGHRVKPMLLADDDRVWLMWERKSDHRASTPNASGDLVGRPGQHGQWHDPVVLSQERVDYRAVHPATADDGTFQAVASHLPRRGLRTYETFDVNPAAAIPFQQDEWTGWNYVELPIASEQPPHRTISVGGRTYHLYWGDFHCHNGLTADAEGEPDELHHYARDRAALDVVVFTNNDFYNIPLTQYEFELGDLFARTFSSRQRADERKLLSLPGYEWTSRIPGVPTASLSDPGNWLPPHHNKSYPNHRSVIYPASGGPLVHFTEVGNDIAKLNDAVDRAGGVTLSQHAAFLLSGHPVEVGMELTSGWSNYILSRPMLFHEPLNAGARPGFTANGDSHRRAPGLSGALTGIYAEELTAAAILDALRQRRCFATMGSKMLVDARANGALMGRETECRDGTVTLTLDVIGTRPIVRAILFRDGEMIHDVAGAGIPELQACFVDSELPAGTHWYYWRVSQAETASVLPGNLMPAHGHLAWSSPHWVVVEQQSDFREQVNP